MNTFILFWNPRISNFKDTERTQFVAAIKNGARYTSDWAIHDWHIAHKGDRFFKIRCGMPDMQDDGIIESGHFLSEPYQGDDWAGRGRVVYYVDLKLDVALDYNFFPVLPSAKLDLRIPHFDWHGGHSGRLLDEPFAAHLEQLWQEHLIEQCSQNDNWEWVYFSKTMKKNILQKTGL